MRSLRTALLGLGGVALCIALAMTLVVLNSDHATNRGVILALVLTLSLSFVGTGLFAWYRRPANPVGPTMAATGFAFFLLGLPEANNSYVYIAGIGFSSLGIVLFLYLLLSFPGQWAFSSLERLLIGGAWLAAIALQVPWLFFFETAGSDGCDDCPANPLLISSNATAADAVTLVQNLIGIAVLAGTIVVLVRRIRDYTPAQRAAILPVYAVAGGALGLFAVSLMMQLAGVGHSAIVVIFIASIIIFTLVPYAFLFGLLRSRFTRSEAVGELVERLSATPAGERELRDELAQALGDPELEIAFWLPQQERYVDAEGRAISLPPTTERPVARAIEGGAGRSRDEGENPVGARAVSEVEHDGRRVAAIIHDRALLEEPGLIRSVGAAASLTLENERLEAELRANVAELRASRARMVEASDAARRRLERDLHDGAQQHLVALSLDLKLVRSEIESDPRKAGELLDQSIEQLDTATAELRELARGIHPAVLTDRGLGEAIKALAARAPLPVEVSGSVGDRFSPPVESAAYFVVAEALTNVARYAQATHAEVNLGREDGRIVVQIRDDGVGGADPSAGSGLRGLEDRVAALDGSMSIVSEPSAGTVVRAVLPCV